MAVPNFDCFAVSPAIKPNPDISGIGMVISFQATAYITFVILVLNYVLVFDPKVDPLSSESLPNEHPNLIDVVLLQWLRKFWISKNKARIWKEPLEKLVIISSDQQLISGIALLSSGFIQLQNGLSSYHWQMITYLVWFSSFTHITTLTMLRRYLRDNSSLRFLRVFLMGIVVCMLVVALVPTARSSWLIDGEQYTSPGVNSNVGVPARCFFDSSKTSGLLFNDLRGFLVLCSMLMVAISYVTRAIKLFQGCSRSVRRLVWFSASKPLGKLHERLAVALKGTSRQRLLAFVPYWSLLCLVVVVKAYLYSIDSMLWEIMWLLLALLWGSVRSDFVRKSLDEENEFGFGQCLAIAMLTLFIFHGLESYLEARRQSRSGIMIATSQSIDDLEEERLKNVRTIFVEHEANCSNNSDGNEILKPVNLTSYNVNGDQARDREISPEDVFPRPRTVRTLDAEEINMETLSQTSQFFSTPVETQTQPEEVGEEEQPSTDPPHAQDHYGKLWHIGLIMLIFLHITNVAASFFLISREDLLHRTVPTTGKEEERDNKWFKELITHLWLGVISPALLCIYAIPFLINDFSSTVEWGAKGNEASVRPRRYGRFISGVKRGLGWIWFLMVAIMSGTLLAGWPLKPFLQT